jgi:hypothetical protein
MALLAARMFRTGAQDAQAEARSMARGTISSFATITASSSSGGPNVGGAEGAGACGPRQPGAVAPILVFGCACERLVAAVGLLSGCLTNPHRKERSAAGEVVL